MDWKSTLLKIWKPLSAIGGAAIAVLLFRSAKSSADSVKAVSDRKDVVDQAVADLKQVTAAAVASISDTNAVESEAKKPEYSSEGKDLQQIVDDYQKE